MKLIIQCAGRKQPDAGSLRMRTGQRVKFVAHPEEAPSSTDRFYAHPDGLSDIPGQTWRQQLAAYNANPLDNSLGLLEAYRLYRNPAYQELVAAFGLTKVFISSAAWGLVRADYLLPYYDLTFAHTKPGEGYKRRMQWDTYNDFSQLPNGENGPIVYFGGNNYLPLLKKFTFTVRRLSFLRRPTRQMMRSGGPFDLTAISTTGTTLALGILSPEGSR
jgi:hypothetical protein